MAKTLELPEGAKMRKLMFCTMCGCVRSFGAAFVLCDCGNMAARWKTPAKIEVEVVASHPEHACILETRILLALSQETLLKVQECGVVSWCRFRQKQIEDGLKIPSDFVSRPSKGRKGPHENGRKIRFRHFHSGTMRLGAGAH